MTATTAAPTPDEAATAEAGAEAVGGTGRGVRGMASLVVTPVVLVAAAIALAVFVGGAEKDSAERSALDWDTKLFPQLREHLALTGWSTLMVLVIAIPLGVLLTRPLLKRGTGPKALGIVNPAVLSVANIGQAAPAFGLFVIFYGWRGTGFGTAVMALVVFALLPVLRNTMVGLDQVDRAVIEAGRGMGMSKLRVLLQIELPLAVPVILAGVRTALVINVGMATLAFLIGGGGLGISISAGLKLSRDLVTFTAAAMAGILALSVDWLAAVVERFLRPKGI